MYARFILFIPVCFVGLIALGTLSQCKTTQATVVTTAPATQKPVVTVPPKVIVDSVILSSFTIDSYHVKYVKKILKDPEAIVYQIYKHDMVNNRWKMDVNDTLFAGNTCKDSVFDCNGDQIPDLVIAQCAYRGRLGSCNNTVFTFYRKLHTIRSLSCLATKFNVSYFPEQQIVATYDINYNYELVKRYKWTDFDALTLYQIDSLEDPMLHGIKGAKTLHTTLISNYQSTTTKTSGSMNIGAEFKHYFGR